VVHAFGAVSPSSHNQHYQSTEGDKALTATTENHLLTSSFLYYNRTYEGRDFASILPVVCAKPMLKINNYRKLVFDQQCSCV